LDTVVTDEEEPEQRRCFVEAAVPAEEGGVGEDAAPGPADEGGAEQALGLVRWEAEEDLSDGVVDQLRRRAPRRHGAGWRRPRVWDGIGKEERV